MRLFRLFALAITMLCVMGIAVSSASALENPEILSGTPQKFTTTSGSGILESSASAKSKIECTTDASTGEFTSVRLGTALIEFLGCKSNGLVCLSIKPLPVGKEGQILTGTADIHLADTEIEKALALLLAVRLISPLVVECGVGVTVEISGTVLGLASGITSGVATETGTITFAQKLGVQAITTCKLDAAFCAKGPFSLSANFGKKGAAAAGEETVEAVKFLPAKTKVTIDF